MAKKFDLERKNPTFYFVSCFLLPQTPCLAAEKSSEKYFGSCVWYFLDYLFDLI